MELDDYITEEFNRACELLEKLCEGMKLSDDALRQYGSAAFSLAVMEDMPDSRSELECQQERMRLAALYASAPYAPPKAIDAVCMGYLMLSLVTDQRFGLEQTAQNQLRSIMDAFCCAGTALGHFHTEVHHLYAASKAPAQLGGQQATVMREMSKKALDVAADRILTTRAD